MDTTEQRAHPAALMTLVVGLISCVLAIAHLYGVLVTASNRRYPYDFRFAALLLVGIVITYAGLVCVTAVKGLAERRPGAWARALSATILLIVVCVPLIPVQQELAGGLTFVGVVNLGVLLIARRRLQPD